MNKAVLAREYRNVVRMLLSGSKGMTLGEIRCVRLMSGGGNSSGNVSTLNVFLQSEVEYHRLLRLYAPLSELSASDKIARTANYVGLSVPA
ncbi:hypothetical protein MOSE0_L03928 [Monosporozyma servazzii]